MNSTPAQAEAICHGEGPMLVLAGPGSGKTTVITGRVRHLIEQHGVHPDNILVITFSKSAALEMQERFDFLTRHAYHGVHFGTFHACFFQILRHAYHYNASHILKENESLRLLTSVMSELSSDYAAEPDLLRTILQEFMSYKGNYALSTEAERAAFSPTSCEKELFFTAYRRYEQALRRENRIDFEDMLFMTYELLTARSDILAMWQNRYEYILVDEFQDINLLQYRITQLLASPQNNLFAVGDDDQSIYGFRGANTALMLHFPNDYPSCKTVLLDTNFRCRPAIVQASGNLIATNVHRYPKKLHSAKQAGDPILYPVFESVSDENDFIRHEISTLLTDGVLPSAIAVLFRTNLQMRSLSEVLLRHGIPFTIRGVLPCLYDTPHVQTVLSYLKLALGSTSRNDYLAVANKPNRYVERTMLADSEINLDELIQSCHQHGKDYIGERLQILQQHLHTISRMNPYAAIHYIRHVIGLNEYLADTLLSPDEAMEQLEELMENARSFAHIGDFLEHVTQYREEYQKHNVERTKKEEGVLLTTFHSCKGLEFSYVFICDCNELLTPHKKALLPEHIAEERRLFYVAMTRAKERLVLCRVKKRFGRDMEPSRFLGEILLPANQLVPGARVIHKQLGSGRIRARVGNHLTVQFEKHLLPKTLSLQHCIDSGLLTLQNASGEET